MKQKLDAFDLLCIIVIIFSVTNIIIRLFPIPIIIYHYIYKYILLILSWSGLIEIIIGFLYTSITGKWIKYLTFYRLLYQLFFL